MSDAELEILKQQKAKLEAKVSDLERRIKTKQGVPVSDPAQLVTSDSDAPYERTTRPLRWKIDCVLCERKGVIATRYPGAPPSICDDCYQQFETGDPNDKQRARNETKRRDKQREKDGKPPRRKAQRIVEGIP